MDFIGTGEQVHEFAEAALERYTWLKTRSIFVCAIAGYNDGIQTLEKNLSDFGVRVLVARTLSSDDRAFSANNSLWDSETDREQARLWCQQLGTLLVQGEFTDPAVHALGWKGSEALISPTSATRSKNASKRLIIRTRITKVGTTRASTG